MRKPYKLRKHQCRPEHVQNGTNFFSNFMCFVYALNMTLYMYSSLNFSTKIPHDTLSDYQIFVEQE